MFYGIGMRRTFTCDAPIDTVRAALGDGPVAPSSTPSGVSVMVPDVPDDGRPLLYVETGPYVRAASGVSLMVHAVPSGGQSVLHVAACPYGRTLFAAFRASKRNRDALRGLLRRLSAHGARMAETGGLA